MALGGRHATTDAEGPRTTWQLVCGFLVVLGAGVATAHGLFEVATQSGVPGGLAWIYPVITDGLALVAYASAVHFAGGARKYAWTVVVLAAGLSGLAQAALLAAGPATGPVGGGAGMSAAATADPMLRFGVGAWPAVAAAISAHLLFLLREARQEQAKAATEQARAQVEDEAARASARRVAESDAQRRAAEAETARIAAENAPKRTTRKRAAAATRRPPAGAKPRKTPATAGPAPEIGTGSVRQQMLAFLDEHADEALAGGVTGGQLDKRFGTNNYGRGVLKTWRDKHDPTAPAVGE